ncbi:short-chain dehydrogenase [Thozetella sp. PMI_491]|nr:short-chain dehydrogenase [Thozetella sp. PMI_491]
MEVVYTHDPKYREVKAPPSTAATSVADLFRLDSRTVVVSGGTGALGTGLTAAVLEGGADVVCLDIFDTPKEADWAPVKAVAEKFGTVLSYYKCNVVDAQEVADTFAKFVPTLRHPIRGLVTCVGISINGPATDLLAESYRKVMDVNVTGTFLIAQAVAKEVIKHGQSASMVLVASISGQIANKGTDNSAYNPSKAAVIQLARSLASEWGSRIGIPLIRVNTLSPGFIRTAALQVALDRPGLEEAVTGDSMLYRLSNVDEYRAPVLFMLSDGSSYMTGADLRVDGGMCAW